VTVDVAKAVEVARRAVEAAAEIQLRHFRAGVSVETKADRSPVTIADKESEAGIFAILRGAFPDHALLGEETGKHGESEWCWVVDPLDGTRGFTRGGTCWGPIVGLAHRDRAVAGAFALPASGVAFWGAPGVGAFRNGEAVRVSRIREIADATLSLGELRLLAENPGLSRLAKEAASTRCWGDVGGAAMLLEGKAEAWIECGVKPWDLCGIVPIVEAAGGRFTDFEGRPGFASGDAIASNGHVHDAIASALAPRTRA